jgi:DNA-binding FadR family transcriptional regulator
MDPVPAIGWMGCRMPDREAPPAHDGRPAAPRRRTARFPKRGDLVAEEMKRWIMSESLQPNDRLPNEHDLATTFGISRWTAREALKSLEVQGLITISPGPQGGARIADVTQQNAIQLLGNYFYFKPLRVAHLYDLRRVLEPMMAAEAIEHLDEIRLAALEASIAVTRLPAHDESGHRAQRVAELEFHNILADACPNLLLGFVCRFINNLMLDWVVLNRTYVEAHDAFRDANVHYHDDLLAAFRAKDRAAVIRIMTDHMADAAHHTVGTKVALAGKFL